jgi:serine-type D-Ala-D-Ala carboxypeptidase (penicillin-binding protein 5/6)
MSRLDLVRFLCLLLSLSGGAAAQTLQPPPIAARSWLLMDVSSGQPIAGHNADERIEPASLTKLMTAYVAFAAIRQKTVALDQKVPVSVRAWRAGGSRMFIQPNKPVTVEELLHGVIVDSGNDACIALAEAIAGSEEMFVQLMNREAQRLGMSHTSFVNASGLPDPKHYSTASDLALLTSALIRDFPEYYKLYSVREYRYNNITQHNRNRLLWLDPNVDGVKTGHTESAGYCLVASAHRGTRRLMSVVLGTSSESLRAQESQKLLNYGFQFFDSVRLYQKEHPISTLEVWKGSASRVRAGLLRDLFVTVPKGEGPKLKAELLSQQPLIAPIAAGQRIGTLHVTLDGKPLADYPVLALESVGIAGWFGRSWDSFRLWFK